MIADRIISLGLLAAGLSHHIRNSLVAVKTFLDLTPIKLREENLDPGGLRNPDFWKDYYQNVQGQIERINNMLKYLWVATEPPHPVFRDEVDVRTAIDEVAGQLKGQFAARGVAFENAVPSTLPTLLVEKPKFYRMLELLLKDEIVSLPAGSRVNISAQYDPADKTQVQIVIQDNGPGLPEEALRLIFDPFAVRGDSPLEYGINLMACYFIVHHHGGRIDAQSNGQGTTFTLRLPLNANQPLPAVETEEFLQKVLLNESLWEKLAA
jgi:two-component system, probable response regulator PhcQ